MKVVVFVLLLMLALACAKPVKEKSELPHSREFYAGYIKAITDNFDQLFESDRQVRSTKDEEPKDDKITRRKMEKRSLTSLETRNDDVDVLEDIGNMPKSSPDMEASKRSLKKILSNNAEKRSREDMYEVPMIDGDIHFVSNAEEARAIEGSPIQKRIYKIKKAVPIIYPQPKYFDFQLVLSQPIFKVENPEVFTPNPFPATIGVYARNGMMLTPLPIASSFLLPSPERSAFTPLNGEARHRIQTRVGSIENKCPCLSKTGYLKSIVQNPNPDPNPPSVMSNETTTRDANPKSDSNNCCCNNNNNGGGTSNNNNNNCCCCCCQPCCCCCNNNNNNNNRGSSNGNQQNCCCCCQPCCCHCCCCEPCCCHHSCCCQPCCHEHCCCCCQPCCHHCFCCQQHCCCHHHVHDCTCCHHDIHDHDCCQEHDCEHCCPVYHHKKIMHCHCHSYPPCCHESHGHESHCCHIQHRHPCCCNGDSHHSNHCSSSNGHGYFRALIPLRLDE